MDDKLFIHLLFDELYYLLSLWLITLITVWILIFSNYVFSRINNILNIHTYNVLCFISYLSFTYAKLGKYFYLFHFNSKTFFQNKYRFRIFNTN